MSGRRFGLDLPADAGGATSMSVLTRLRAPGGAGRAERRSMSIDGIDATPRVPARGVDGDDRATSDAALVRGGRVDIEHVVIDGIALPDPHRQPLLLRTIREELARLTAAHPQALRTNRRPMSADTALRRGRMPAEVAASGDPRRLGVEIARQLHRAMTRDADAAIGSGAGPEDAT